MGDDDEQMGDASLPPLTFGAGGASGRTDAERASSTEAVMKFTAGVLFLYNEREGRYPADLSDLADFAAGRDSRRDVAGKVGDVCRAFPVIALKARP